MMVSIKKMEKNINEFEGDNVSNFKDLSKTTKANLSHLTASCTMTGQSHDELHKWLLPFFDLNSDLSKTENTNDGSKIVEDLQYELFVFNLYFE